jgi:vacuolar-type H+-ATPase subunit F/Vma7
VRIRFVGSSGDALGFSLAGIAGALARDRREADKALEAIESDGGAGLLLVSASVRELSPRALERIRRRGGLPALVILPPEAAEGAPA